MRATTLLSALLFLLISSAFAAPVDKRQGKSYFSPPSPPPFLPEAPTTVTHLTRPRGGRRIGCGAGGAASVRCPLQP